VDDETKRRVLGVAMVAVGFLQSGAGALSENWVFAALGLLYALIGVLQYWQANGD